MAVFTVELEDVTTSIKKNVIDSIVTNVMTHFGIKDTVDVIYQGDYTTAKQPGSTEAIKRDVSFGSSEKIIVEVDEIRDPTNYTDRGTALDNNPPIYHDSFYDIKIVPNLVRYESTITAEYRAISRTIAVRWINEISRKMSLFGDVFLTSANFHYLIPIEILDALGAIFEAKNAKVPDGDLLDMLISCFSGAVTVFSDEGGHTHSYGVRNQLMRIECVFTVDDEPKAVKANDTGAWSVALSWKFTYDRPESLTICYPCMINNTLMPERYWDNRVAINANDETGALQSVHVEAQDYLSVLNLGRIPIPYYIPMADEFAIPKNQRYYGEIILIKGYLSFDSPSQRLAYNLNDLGDIYFKPNVVKYLKECFAKDNTAECSVIRPWVYKDGIVHAVTVDSDLNVFVKEDIVLTSLYTFGISIRTNLYNLNDDGDEILINYPDIIQDIIDGFYPPATVPDELDWPDYDDIKDSISDHDAFKDYSMYEKSTCYILDGTLIAHRKEIE